MQKQAVLVRKLGRFFKVLYSVFLEQQKPVQNEAYVKVNVRILVPGVGVRCILSAKLELKCL